MKRLSGYRILWLMVLFDLPVVEEVDRKAATAFRQFLLDEGFEMAQFSVYMRHCSGKENAEKYYRHIEMNLPPGGSVHIITLTDKQFENIVRFQNTVQEPRKKNPDQLCLF